MSLGSSGKPSTVEWTPRPGTAVHPPTHHDPQLSDLGQGQGIPDTSPPLGHSEGHNQHSLLSVGCDGDQTHRGMNVTVAGPDTASGEWDGGHNPPRLPPSRPPKLLSQNLTLAFYPSRRAGVWDTYRHRLDLGASILEGCGQELQV